ncbi:FKBP-type peptidyl-prolyl cis-trans isomerase N-terminal domain-containing protein [Entomohabitans teleogrylli]|uniref:FKBP-type peptidyl-prolyl cis-trans isomerase N-terminal domain-containing protein n=1 Tax=Entomohabitans teleogrylli TaxID=1384589 RepID=UPI00073D4583|nr:FKBP-type peptidyl-prolyl cis-trans isomerase N-terminal domain-containing protein [Entomohabitans teleogrylli]
MAYRSGRLITLLVALLAGICLTPAYADDVFSFAREWAQREDSKATPAQAKQNAGQASSSKKSARAEKKPAAKPLSSEVKPAAKAPATKVVSRDVKPAAQDKPVAQAAKPAVQDKPVAQAAKPAVQDKPVAQAAKPAVQDKPVTQAAKPAVQDKPVAQAAKPAVQDKPVAQAVKPAVQDKPVAQAAKPAVQDKPVAQATQSPTQQKPVIQVAQPAAVATAQDAPPPALADPVLLGRWIKTLTRAVAPEPGEEILRQQNMALRSEIRTLEAQAARSQPQQELQARLEAREKQYREAVLALQSQMAAREAHNQQQQQTLQSRLTALETQEKQYQETVQALQSQLAAREEREAPPDIARAQSSPAAVEMADPQLLGRWIKTLADAVAPAPEEESLERINARLRDETHKLQARLAALDQREHEQQETLQALQKRLKETQHPSLPKTQRGLEDFVAGMMTGRDVASLLEIREEWGVQIDKEAFLAGVRESVRGDNRLSDAEFARHMAGMDKRLEKARDRVFEEREKRDREWLMAFRQEKNVSQSEEGIWYRVNHQGESVALNHQNTELIISLSRRLADGTLLEDSDISGELIQAPLVEYPGFLQKVLSQIGKRGEAELAVTVNRNGEPDRAGHMVELWRVRMEDFRVVPTQGTPFAARH